MKPTLVIITGPQGAGNHLFSKVLALHPVIAGWQALLDSYWIGHDEEPFAQHWKIPSTLSEFNWSASPVFVTSISCPYVDNGDVTEPRYKEFIREASKYAKIKVIIIGRDPTILAHQQTRVRGSQTVQLFKEHIKELLANDVLFVSQELLYLYKLPYVNHIENFIGIPPSADSSILSTILIDDANEKYIQPIDEHWLDVEVAKASRKR